MAGVKPITVSLGEVLWDMLPDGKALGGAPTNVAWHAAQLGAEAHVVSAVGRDALGEEILARLADMRLNVAGVAVVDGRPTGTVDATLDEKGNASYVIHENVAWDYLPVGPEILKLAARADAVNFGSLAQRGGEGRRTTTAILAAVRPESVRVFDINLRTPFIYPEVIDGGLRLASVVKMNNEELPLLAGMFGWAAKSEDTIVQLLAAYPNLRHAVVTQGGDGIWWHDRHTLYRRKPNCHPDVVDTIGAGDSVTAASMMGLLKGWKVEEIIDAALNIAAFVCSSRGGTPELPAGLKSKFLS